ncbi:MAG: YkvA family protein [Pseudomonadota bacterium]
MAIPDWISRLLRDAVSNPDRARENLSRVQTGFIDKLRKTARVIPFSEDLLAAYFCAFDRNTPAKVRATLIGALAYFVLPLDTIPDFILTIGFGDDATVLLAALSMVAAHVTDDHRAAARAALEDGDDADLEDIAKGDADDILDLEAIEVRSDDAAPTAPADNDPVKPNKPDAA